MEYGNRASRYQDAFPGYLNNLGKETDSEYAIDGLEQIVMGKERKEGVLDMLFSDKAKTLKATVKELLNEVDLRKRLNSDLLAMVNGEICKLGTYLCEIKDVTRRNYEADELKFGRRRTQLEGLVLNLEQEKRKEYVECWRDLMFLKKYLMSALTDYWELSRKRDSLSYGLDLKEENTEAGKEK